MNVALMVITDGRWDYLAQTVASAEVALDFPFVQKLIVDDSGERVSPPPRDGWEIVKNPERRGLAGAIQTGWDHLHPDVDYVFHLEDDFVFPYPVDVEEMVRILQDTPMLAQVALMRQAWSPEEQQAGGIYGLFPDEWKQGDGAVFHRRLFTFNPSVYPRVVTEYGADLEQGLTDRLLADGWWFSYLGTLGDDPKCWHIGVRRSAGYRW